jgi:hypothetical protein
MRKRRSEARRLRERIDPNVSLGTDRQDRIDEAILWPCAANIDEISNRQVHQSLRLGAGNRREKNEAGMKIDARRELAKILGILGDENPVLRNGPGEDDMIGFPQPSSIAGDGSHRACPFG